LVFCFEKSKGLKVWTTDGQQFISSAEFYSKGFMIRDVIISKLKDYKELLDLGVIELSKFDVIKTYI
jgi:hypothetical protein